MEILVLGALGFASWIVFAVIKFEILPWIKARQKHRITLQAQSEDRELAVTTTSNWETFKLPTKENFALQLYNAYQGDLIDSYLIFLCRAYAELYCRAFEPKTRHKTHWYRTSDPETAFNLMVKLCAEGLKLHTPLALPHVKQVPEGELFSAQVSLLPLVYDEKQGWQNNQEAAYLALYAPIKQHQTEVEEHKLFSSLDEQPQIDFKSVPDHDLSDAGHNRFMKAVEANEATQKKANAKVEPYQRTFLSTPFFAVAEHFLPRMDITMPLSIAPDAWFSGTWIVAPPNQGKTNLLHQIIKDRRAHGTVILMDAGTKTELIAPYQHEAFIIEPSQTNPPPINPLDLGSSIHSIELLEYLFSSLLEAKMTPKQSTLFSNVLTLATSIPNATIETVRQILLDGWKKDFEKYVMRLPRRTQEFFTKEQFDGKGDAGYSGTKKELLWRIDLLLRNPYMDAMLQTPNTGIDFTKLLDSGKIITIDCNPELIGYEGAEFFGRLIIALVWNAVRARARAQGTKRPVYFIIDEAQEVIKRDENIPKLLQQCRSQNVAMIFAHQQLNQIDNEKVQYALGDCAIKLAAPRREAPLIAPFFSVDASFFTMLEHHFALQVFSKPPSVVTVELLTMVVRPRPTPPQPVSELRWTHRISPILARRGGDYRMKTLKGEIIVTIPPNTKNGAVFRLRGCGTLYNDGTRGDIILTLDVPPMPEQQQSDSPLLFFDDDMG